MLGVCNLAFPLDDYGGDAARRLYAFGGVDGWAGKSRDKVFSAPLAEDGSVSPFEAEESMEVALGSYGGAATVVRFYAIGGTDGMGDPSNQAEMGALGATGQWSWSKLPSVPSPRAGSSAAVFGAHLFVFGGTQPSGDAD